MNRAVQVPGEDCAHLVAPGDCFGEAGDPRGVRIPVEPVQPYGNRGVVHRDHHRCFRIGVKLVAQPLGPLGTECAAVPPRFECIERD